MTATVFHGIDFANKKANHGQCWLIDDGAHLSARFGAAPSETLQRTAVDCPFGTTVAFERLLRGEPATNETVDVFKSRATERLLRRVVTEYQVNRDWQARSVADREQFPRASFFNGSSHVQPSVGMVIVPELLGWLADHAGTDAAARLAAMRRARLGEGAIVEAHPRLFLYSALERLRRLRGTPFTVEELDAIAGYKGSDADAEARRARVFDLLRTDGRWLGFGDRALRVDDVAALVDTDHAFDAWLSALTAWAHEQGETWAWQTTNRLDRATVEVEGHILVLRINDA